MTPIQKTVEKLFSKYKLISLPAKKPIAYGFVYYLVEGWVRLYTICPKGNELTLHIYEPGSFFPMEKVLGNVTHDYALETLSAAKLYECPEEDFLIMVKKKTQILMDLVSRLTSGTFKLLNRIEMTAGATASQKIESVLTYLGRHFGNPITPHFTHLDISKITGLTRETVSLEMEKLEEKGKIVYKGRKLFIKS